MGGERISIQAPITISKPSDSDGSENSARHFRYSSPRKKHDRSTRNAKIANTTHLAAFRVLEVLVVMIVVIEVARLQGDVVAAARLTHERLLSLQLHLL